MHRLPWLARVSMGLGLLAGCAGGKPNGDGSDAAGGGAQLPAVAGGSGALGAADAGRGGRAGLATRGEAGQPLVAGGWGFVAGGWGTGEQAAGKPGSGGAPTSDSGSPSGDDEHSDTARLEYEAASASRPPGIGPCGDTFVDYQCDAILDPCPEGMHRDFDPGDPCGVCVDDPEVPLTCAAARERYLALLDHVILSSCADFCETAADCYLLEISSQCMAGCSYALFGGIDEEIEEVAGQFSAESCAPVCGDATAPSCAAAGAMTPACIDNRCVLQPAGS